MQKNIIFVDGSNLTGSGASIVGLNLLKYLPESLPNCNFIYYLPSNSKFESLTQISNVRKLYRDFSGTKLNWLSRLFDLHFRIPYLVKKFDVDLCLCLGDIAPIKLSCNRIIFVHQSMLVEEQKSFKIGSSWSPLKRKYLLWHFSRSLRDLKALIVQTPIMASKLSKKYRFGNEKIRIISQPIPEHILYAKKQYDYQEILKAGEKTKLLFLASYYPHKNHQILSAVINEIKIRGLESDIQIFLTLSEKSKNISCELLNLIRQNKKLIANLGEIPMDMVASVLQSSDALFLPTLTESYGLIYIEAMACKKPILTSDLDFAHWMCGDYAYYFDPNSAVSIVNAIEKMRNNPQRNYNEIALKRLSTLPKDWQTVASSFSSVISEFLQ